MINKINNPLDQCLLKFSNKAKAGEFTGYASIFNGNDQVGDTILPGAFDKSLADGFEHVKMFLNHDHNMVPIGDWKGLVPDEHGLKATGIIDLNHMMGETVYSALKRGAMDGLSIGFKCSKGDYIVKDEDDPFSGRNYKNMNLLETSVVSYPCETNATISDVKAEQFDLTSMRDFEVYLRDVCGLSKNMARKFISQFKNVVRCDAGAVGAEQIDEGAKRISTTISQTLNRIKEL